jgi:hypothetical protein
MAQPNLYKLRIFVAEGDPEGLRLVERTSAWLDGSLAHRPRPQPTTLPFAPASRSTLLTRAAS